MGYTSFGRLAGVIGLFFLLCGGVSAEIAKRKNIDLLTPSELAAYEHAIQILRDRSDANAFNKAGFVWQAWVHDCFVIWQPPNGFGSHGKDCDEFPSNVGLDEVHPGKCEHGKDLFLPWHRAQLFYFEQILRASDPDGTVTDSRGITGPSTMDVAVPYWNWTRPPSGIRYPKAFEVPASPLFDLARARDAFDDEEKIALEEVTNPLAIAALVYEADWRTFGGFAQEAPIGSFGRIESDHHNRMHEIYFGNDSDMSNSGRAALDPAFYSFHAYIDLLYQFWLDAHGSQSVTSLDHFLRGTQPTDIAPPPGYAQGVGLPSMGKARIYLDPETVGFRYEVTADDRLQSRESVMAALNSPSGEAIRFGSSELSPEARLSGDGLNDPSTGPPTFVDTLNLTVSTANVETRAIFRRPPGATDVTFLLDFYLHPAGVAFDFANGVDRRKYVVAAMGYWAGASLSGHGAHGPAKPVSVDLTAALGDLAETGHEGEVWELIAVASGPAPIHSFGTLSLAH